MVILLFALTIAASAQRHEKQTVVLHGGPRITGTIVVDSSDFLKLRITSPQVVKIKKSEVLFITPLQKIEKPVADMHGYSIRISASVLAGRDSKGSTGSMSFHLSNGYRFRNGLSSGLGAGFEKLDVDLLPVYADLRYHPFKTRLSPFLWIKSGYAFPVGDHDGEQNYYYGSYTEPRGGLMLNAGTGIALYSWQRNAVNIGIGYRYQKISFRQVNTWREGISNELVTYFNRIELQFGLIFR